MTRITVAMWILLAFVVVTMGATVLVWRAWMRAEERHQRERLRQRMNGGDMPSWAELLDRARRRRQP